MLFGANGCTTQLKLESSDSNLPTGYLPGCALPKMC